MKPPLPVSQPSPLAHQRTKAFFLLFLPQCLKDHSSQRTFEVHHAPSSHLRVLLGLPRSKMWELGVFKVTPSCCRNLLLCMWHLWKQMKQQAEDMPLKGCWHIICFTEIQTVLSRMQEQNSHQADQDAFIYELIHKPGERRWISPTSASSQSSPTGDVSINQPQSHLQKGSILIVKQHLHRAVNLKCALRK